MTSQIKLLGCFQMQEELEYNDVSFMWEARYLASFLSLCFHKKWEDWRT